jgi:hypothetical protein
MGSFLKITADVELPWATLETPAMATFQGTLFVVHRGTSSNDNLVDSGGDTQLHCFVASESLDWNWSAGPPLPAGCVSATGPALAVCGSVLFCVFRGATDDNLHYATLSSATGASWSDPQLIGRGGTHRSRCRPALATLGPNLYCVHVGKADDPNLWWFMLAPGPTIAWTADRRLDQDSVPGNNHYLSNQPPALVVLDDTLFCVHKGEDNDYLWWIRSAGSPSIAWAPDTKMAYPEPYEWSVTSANGPALVVFEQTLYCLHTGIEGDQGLYFSWLDSSSGRWQRDFQFPQHLSGAGPAAVSFNDIVVCAHRGRSHPADKSIWYATLEPILGPANDPEFWANALLGAKMAQLSYKDEDPLRAEMAVIFPDYILKEFYDDSHSDTQGFFAFNGTTKTIVLCFRGTSGYLDYWSDAWQNLVPWTNTAIGREIPMVVSGFLSAYRSINLQALGDVCALIDQLGGPEHLTQIIVCGHSLGGELAAFACLELAVSLSQKYSWRNRNVLRYMSYATPPIGNDKFRDMWTRAIAENYLSAFTLLDPTDPIGNGYLTSLVAGWILHDLFHIEPVYDVKTGTGHPIANYVSLLTAGKPGGTPLTSLSVLVTTGTGTVAPWWIPDTPGTDRNISFTIGVEGGAEMKWDLDNAWHDDFESGNTDRFDFDNVGWLALGDLQQFTIAIDISGGFMPDNWMLDGVEIIADQQTIYNRQSMGLVLGPSGSYPESFHDRI